MKSSQKRILVLEDDGAVSRAIHTCLTRAGYKDIFVTDSGEDALAAHRRSPFSIATIDCMLPQKNGVEMCKELKTTHPNPFTSLHTDERGLQRQPLYKNSPGRNQCRIVFTKTHGPT